MRFTSKFFGIPYFHVICNIDNNFCNRSKLKFAENVVIFVHATIFSAYSLYNVSTLLSSNAYLGLLALFFVLWYKLIRPIILRVN